MPRFINTCSADELEKYFEEFHATKDSIRDGVRYIKEWMEQQRYLPLLDDDDILVYLFRGKNNLERTKKIIDLYYSSKAMMPEIFDHIKPNNKEILDVIECFSYVPMPNLTPDGHRIVVFRIYKYVEEFPSELSILRAQQLILSLFNRFDHHYGYIIIYDFDQISLTFVRFFALMISKMLALTTKISPLRYKKVFIVNCPLFAESLVTLGKSIVRKELSERVVVWKKSITELATVLPKECLSVDLGGSEKPLVELRDEFFAMVPKYENWFIAEDEKRADLSKKPTEAKFQTSEFGVDGSFRKICLD